MASRTEILRVEQSRPADRLDHYLRERFPALSRGTIQRLIEQGHITVNGQCVKPTHHPRAGETIAVHWPEPKPAVAQPEAIPLDILFEDSDLLVLNKPAGLVVHPGAGHNEHTLVNALLHHCAGQLSGIGGVARPGIVHRLDKDTSGCLVIAKNDTAHLHLAAQFAGRQVTKIYHGLVCGVLPHNQGEVRAAIARHPSHRKRMAVTEGGREAHTRFRVIERFDGATLVEIELHTGRTHQVRVHFHHIGFPLVGDETYGAKQNRRLLETRSFGSIRQMLHAKRLGFNHPRTGRRLHFEAPWPPDFAQAVEILQRGRGKT